LRRLENDVLVSKILVWFDEYYMKCIILKASLTFYEYVELTRKNLTKGVVLKTFEEYLSEGKFEVSFEDYFMRRRKEEVKMEKAINTKNQEDAKECNTKEGLAVIVVELEEPKKKAIELEMVMVKNKEKLDLQEIEKKQNGEIHHTI